jgi:subtilisin
VALAGHGNETPPAKPRLTALQPTFANIAHGDLVQELPVPPREELVDEWLLAGQRGRGVRICLIDSGVDYSHHQIRNVGSSYTVMATDDQEFQVVETEDLDVVGHGTACASVISRVADEAELDSLRILGPKNQGHGSFLLAGLAWAISQGYHIINLSLSARNADHRPRFLELAEMASAAGVLLVCSAHNSPVKSYPWTLASVISVGSHSNPDAYEVQINPDPPVDFYAGGVGVQVAWLDGTTRVMSGNSFATPAIVANLARIIERFPDLRTWQYKYLLSLLATNVRRRTND